MKLPFSLHEQEILQQRAVVHDGLCPDARSGLRHVCHREAWAVFPAHLQVSAPGKGVPELSQSRAPMRSGQTPEAAKLCHVEYVARFEAELRVSLSVKPQHRIRTNGNPTVDHACQMDPEELQPRIRHRIDQVLDDCGT